MNIGGNLGMGFLSSDVGTSAIANAAGAVSSGSVGLTAESPFQKLILMTMANKSTPVTGSETGTGTVLNNGSAQETNSISDMLAGLLYGNVNQAKLKLQTDENSLADNEEVGELLQDDTDTTEPTEEDSLATILAMFAGPFKTYSVASSGNVNSAPSKIELSGDVVSKLLESVQRNGLGSSENLNNQSTIASVQLISYGVDGSGNMTVSADIDGKRIEFTGTANEAMMSDLYGGMNELAESNQGASANQSAALLKSNGQSVNLLNIGRLESIDSEQADLKTGRQETTAQPGMKISETRTGAPLEVGGKEQNLQQGIAASNEKLEMELDKIENSMKTPEYQGQLQNTGITDITNQISQPVDKAEAYSQISGEILTKLEQKGPTEFKMQLEPENLGQIDISLKLNQGKLVIDISAQNSKTQALLTNQVDKLISSMGLQNVQVERVIVGLQNVQVESVQTNQQMNSGSQNSQNQGYQMNSGMDFSQRRQHSQETGGNFRQSNFGFFGTQSDDAIENVSGIQLAKNNYKLDYVI